MRYFQRLKNMVFNVSVKWLSRHSLKNVTGNSRGVIGISRRREWRIDSDRQMPFHVLIKRRQVFCAGDEELLDRLFKSRRVRHDVPQCNRLGKGGRNLEVEVVIDVAIQVELSQLDLLHD